MATTERTPILQGSKREASSEAPTPTTDDRSSTTTFSGFSRKWGAAALGGLAVTTILGRAIFSGGPYHLGVDPDRPWMWGPRDGVLLAPTPPTYEGATTFRLHSQCKTGPVRKDFSDFWLDGQKEAYVVRHNYGSPNFFDHTDAVKMSRVKFTGSEERGYELTTSGASDPSTFVNFEWGFAFKDVASGAFVYEIGTETSPLGKYNCTQMYGAFYNRVLTKEVDPAAAEYVFGSCAAECPADYVDSAFDAKTKRGDLPGCSEPESSWLLLGEGDDARLVTVRSGMLGIDGVGPSGRALVVRDTQYADESETQSRYILNIIDPYPKSDIKMAGHILFYSHHHHHHHTFK